MEFFLKFLIEKCRVPKTLVQKWITWNFARKLAAVDKRMALTPPIRGLTEAECGLLSIRMLQELCCRQGIRLGDDELPELAGLPQGDELIDKISSEQAAQLLRNEVDRIRSSEVAW